MCTESFSNKIMMRRLIISEQRTRETNLNLAHFKKKLRDWFIAIAKNSRPAWSLLELLSGEATI